MAKVIGKPMEIHAHGNKTKLIQEYIGRVNTKSQEVSIARMKSPEGWAEPGQTPVFNEYTIVFNGTLCVKTRNETFEVKAGQAFVALKGEWVQYSTPCPDGAEYIAVCIPAFSPQLVYRDEKKNS
jgi:quercetin dioxygenase-like cupin family protein